MSQVISTVNQYCEKNPAFTPGGVRWDIFNAETNGLAESGAILRKGRRVYIVDDRYFAWLERQSGIKTEAA
jgi:hypothetical protein